MTRDEAEAGLAFFAAGDERRDRQEQLVDQPLAQHRTDDVRACFEHDQLVATLA